MRIEINIIQFVRLEDRGFGLVAVFSEFGHREFSLCENDLKERIANLAKYGHPCAVERAALAEMTRRRSGSASGEDGVCTPSNQDDIDYLKRLRESSL